jgi:hypothetical protein
MISSHKIKLIFLPNFLCEKKKLRPLILSVRKNINQTRNMIATTKSHSAEFCLNLHALSEERAKVAVVHHGR